MNTNQNAALTDAQPQPSASNSPNRARRLGVARPAGSAALAMSSILAGPAAPGGSSAVDQLAVSVPIMFGWTSHTNEYVPAGRAFTW